MPGADTARDFRIREHGVGLAIEAQWGVLQGTAIREMWQRFMDAEFMTDWEAARTLHGDRVSVTQRLPRTAAQHRGFDAFFRMLEAGATDISGAALADPVVNVIVDLDTFEQHLHAELGGPVPRIDPAGILDRRCGSSRSAASRSNPRDVVALAMVRRRGRARRTLMMQPDALCH